MDILAREIQQAFRQLGKARWFTVSAALTIGLGIGATTSVFAVFDAVLLRDLNHKMATLNHNLAGSSDTHRER